MPCEHYKDALIEVAATGTTPQGELRAHLAGCASCRAAFDQEQSLFAAIDSGIHAAVNEEVPGSLLPRIRARLSEVEVRGLRWVQPLAFASAGLALACAVLLLVRPRHTTPEEVAKQGAVVTPTPQPTSAKANPETIPSRGTQISAVRVAHSHAAPSSTIPHSVASGNLEVLVPPDEREGLTQLVATLNRHRDFAAAFLAQRPEKKDAPVTVDPLKIPDIEIKPLAGTETKTSDGTGEKHQRMVEQKSN